MRNSKGIRIVGKSFDNILICKTHTHRWAKLLDGIN